MGLARTPGQHRSATPNQLEDALQQISATPRRVPHDGSLTARQRPLIHPIAELVERSMEVAHVRRVSFIKEELANGSYKPVAADLAECLLRIAERDYR